MSDAGRSLIDTVRALDAAGIEPADMNVREPSLDDVFLTLTGHPAEPTDAGSDTDTGTPTPELDGAAR